MMRKGNIAGTAGVVTTGLVWVGAMLVRSVSPLGVVAMLCACFFGLALGLLATISGRKWWFLQCLFAVLTAAFVLFGLVGA